MAFGKGRRLGLAALALTVVGVAGIGTAQAPTQLPTVTVYHDPT